MGSADWLGRTRKLPDSDECLGQLVRKYIENYGPVTRQDIVYWSFLLKRDVDRALEALKRDLIVETFRSKEEYFMYDSFLDAGGPPQVIILPEFDTLMMGYREKSRVLPSDRVKNVFWGLGGISRTILLDGFVAGIWKRKKRGSEMTVTISPLRTFRAREKGAIVEEFSRYADYLQTKISVEFHPSN